MRLIQAALLGGGYLQGEFVQYRTLVGSVLVVLCLSACGGGAGGEASDQANRPPVADAGPDRTLSSPSSVALDGSASSDPDGDTISYQWSVLSSPAGGHASIAGQTSVTPTFTADVAGPYTVSLVVNDGTAASVADTAVISIASVAHTPNANAGPDQSVLRVHRSAGRKCQHRPERRCVAICVVNGFISDR